jgi:zinc transport system substrate-binding protein
MKKILLLLITALLISSCGTTELTNETSSEKNIETTSTTDTEVAVTNEKVQVSSSIIPLSSVINAVGGEYVEVENIVPAGVSPHGFDLSAKQMASISESKIIFLT